MTLMYSDRHSRYSGNSVSGSWVYYSPDQDVLEVEKILECEEVVQKGWSFSWSSGKWTDYRVDAVVGLLG